MIWTPPIYLPGGKGLLNAGKFVSKAEDCCCGECGCPSAMPEHYWAKLMDFPPINTVSGCWYFGVGLYTYMWPDGTAACLGNHYPMFRVTTLENLNGKYQLDQVEGSPCNYVYTSPVDDYLRFDFWNTAIPYCIEPGTPDVSVMVNQFKIQVTFCIPDEVGISHTKMLVTVLGKFAGETWDDTTSAPVILFHGMFWHIDGGPPEGVYVGGWWPDTLPENVSHCDGIEFPGTTLNWNDPLTWYHCRDGDVVPECYGPHEYGSYWSMFYSGQYWLDAAEECRPGIQTLLKRGHLYTNEGTEEDPVWANSTFPFMPWLFRNTHLAADPWDVPWQHVRICRTENDCAPEAEFVTPCHCTFGEEPMPAAFSVTFSSIVPNDACAELVTWPSTTVKCATPGGLILSVWSDDVDSEILNDTHTPERSYSSTCYYYLNLDLGESGPTLSCWTVNATCTGWPPACAAQFTKLGVRLMWDGYGLRICAFLHAPQEDNFAFSGMAFVFFLGRVDYGEDCEGIVLNECVASLWDNDGAGLGPWVGLIPLWYDGAITAWIFGGSGGSATVTAVT